MVATLLTWITRGGRNDPTMRALRMNSVPAPLIQRRMLKRIAEQLKQLGIGRRQSRGAHGERERVQSSRKGEDRATRDCPGHPPATRCDPDIHA